MSRLPGELDLVIDFIAEQYAASGLQVPFDVTAGKAEEILRQLEECGLVVRPSRVEELAQERLGVEP